MNPGESIQDAINASCPRDTIYVHAGTYDENVDVDKQITRIGDGADVLTVRGVDVGDHVFEVTADYVDISGFTVTGATGYGEAGIYLYNADHCNISDNTVSKNYWYGIHLSSSSNNTLQNNTANSNNDYGIILSSSSNHNTLASNTVSNNEYGIALSSSSNNTLASNTANSNDYNGIHLVSSSNHNTLISNTASNNDYGIVLYPSSNHNTLQNNTANSNNEFGIVLPSSSSNTLQNNTANSNNHYGIGMYSSSNTVYHNTLINNTYHNAYDTGTNQWDSGSEGNYWSDYTGTDTNRDGIGDDPYDIPGGSSVDRYPLTGIRGFPLK